MTNTIQIEAATTAAIPAIAALDAASYRNDSYNPGFLYQALMQWPQGLWVATSNNETLGYALIAPGQDAPEAWLMAVVVAEQARGQGLGRKLCKACIERARLANYTRLYLTVAPDNQPAIRLYQTLGFESLELQPDALGPGIHRRIMRLQL